MDYRNLNDKISYSFSSDKVSIDFHKWIDFFYFDEFEYDRYELEIKLSNYDIFPEGFWFVENPDTYWTIINSENSEDNFSFEDDSEEYEGQNREEIYDEEILHISKDFGNYLIVTNELHLQDEKELQGFFEDDEYPLGFKEIIELNPGSFPYYENWGEKIKIEWGDEKIKSPQMLEVKRHLEVALSGINEELKRIILQGGSINGIGDAQKFIVKLINLYTDYFKYSEEALIQQSNEKEERKKKLLSEFGLDDLKSRTNDLWSL